MRELTDSLSFCYFLLPPLLHLAVCDSELTVISYNASSIWEDGHRSDLALEDKDFKGQMPHWSASDQDQQPWLELELWNRSSITGPKATVTFCTFFECISFISVILF